MLLGKSSSKTVPPAPLSEFESGTVLSLSGTVLSLFGGTRGRGWWRSRGATEGEPLPPLASAASRRVGPCTRSVVQRSCTGGPGAASASVTPGRRADSERSGPTPALPREDSKSCTRWTVHLADVPGHDGDAHQPLCAVEQVAELGNGVAKLITHHPVEVLGHAAHHVEQFMYLIYTQDVGIGSGTDVPLGHDPDREPPPVLQL